MSKGLPKNYYAGVGSRDTPKGRLLMMKDIAEYLAKNGWVLRSGGAKGADSAFEEGSDLALSDKQIWLPHDGFNWRYESNGYNLLTGKQFNHARGELEFDIIPWFDKMGEFAKNAHARNYYQIHGNHDEPVSKMVIYWCKEDLNGEPTGGTRTAVILAERAGIKTYNLLHKDVAMKVLKKCNLPWKDNY